MSRSCRTTLTLLALAVVSAGSCVPDFMGTLPCIGIATSFEFTDTSGQFTLSQDSFNVTFIDGLAQRVGNTSLYRTGLFAWMIPAGNTGTIQFEPPAEEVTLFLRDQFAGVASELTFFNPDDEVIATFAGSTEFTNISLSPDSTNNQPIARITLVNSADTGFAVIEDFEACAPVDGGDNGMMSGEPLEDPILAAIEASDIAVRLTPLSEGLVAPNWGISAPGDNVHLYVVDQSGSLWQIDLDTGDRRLFLDVSDRLVELGISGPGSFDERGFLGLAFDPEYMTTGLIYTYTSEPATETPDFSTMPAGSTPNHQSVIVEWRVVEPASADATVDPDSARELLRIDQPQFNHNAGALNFGPDGLLYVSIGDGGGADDGQPPLGHSDVGNGQDTTNPLGAVLRIDPEGSDADNGAYGIPLSNPFVTEDASGKNVEEIFAYGFRNPFRFSFDMQTGDIFLADAGQNDIEEVDIVQIGGNYGWNMKEGSFFFQPNGDDTGTVTDVDPGTPDDLIDPVAEYDHDEGVVIVGGFVYRGTAIPELVGRYVFADFGGPDGSSGRLFYLNADQRILELQPEIDAESNPLILGFGQDVFGEVYVLANSTGTPFQETGTVFRLDSAN